jgi:RHS repeat-associated protein
LTTQTLSWTPDSRQAGYTAAHSAVASVPAFTDTRTYPYDARRRLTSESYTSLAHVSQRTHSYAFDASGMNIRTTAQTGSAASDYQANVNGTNPAVGSGGIDEFARVTGETTTDAPRKVVMDGQYTAGGDPLVSAWVSAKPAATFADAYPVLPITTSGAGTNKTWEAPYAYLRPRPAPDAGKAFTLQAQVQLGTATQPAPVKDFTVASSSTPTAISSAYDAQGRVVRRTFSVPGNTSAPELRTQWLTWDHLDRLIRVEERAIASANDTPTTADLTHVGYTWTALYDGLSRRIQTRLRYLAANGLTVIGDLEQVETSTYDPAHEFLEVRVQKTFGDAGTVSTINLATQSQTWWKVHGPDSSGTYGGHNGIGGLEATYEVSSANVATGQWSVLIDDVYGHIVGSIEVTGTASATYRRSPTQSLGYGPAPGSVVAHLTGSITGTLAQATNWRGRRMDVTGFYYLGARYYESTGGRFLSPDPMGHGASLSLYDYAGGDPVNWMDADGRSPSPQGDPPKRRSSVGRFFNKLGNWLGGDGWREDGVEHIGGGYYTGSDDTATSVIADPANPNHPLTMTVKGTEYVYTRNHTNTGLKRLLTAIIGPFGKVASEGWEPASNYPGSLPSSHMTQLVRPNGDMDEGLLKGMTEAAITQGLWLETAAKISVNLATLVGPSSGQVVMKAAGVLIRGETAVASQLVKIPVYNGAVGKAAGENCVACAAAYLKHYSTGIMTNAVQIERQMYSKLGVAGTQISSGGAAASYVQNATQLALSKPIGFGPATQMAEGSFLVIGNRGHAMAAHVMADGSRIVFCPQNHVFMTVETAMARYGLLQAYRVLK